MRLRFPAAWMGLACFAATASADGYPDTADGLRKLSTDIVTLVKARDSKADALIKDLVLPDAPAYFKKLYGDELGAKAADEYAKLSGRLQPEIRSLFEMLVKDGRSEVKEVVRIEKAEDAGATGAQKKALELMKEKTPLYTVRFGKADGSGAYTIWSFVHTGGGFRLVGKLRSVTMAK